MKKHPMYLTAVLVAFLGLLLLPMAGQKPQTEKAEAKTNPIKPQVEILNLSLNPLPVLDIAVMHLTLDPTPLEDILDNQKTRMALTVKNDIRLKLEKEIRARVNLNLRVRIPPFINPVPGADISSGFGERLHPKTKELMHHNGVDLAAKTGTTVLAAGDGMVIKANGESPDEVYGFFVIIAHGDGFETLYSSLDKVLVTEGEEIRQGDVIGHVGQTGQATGPHLHFELRKDGNPVDPADFIKFQK